MAKLLKFMVILLLIISIAALTFGIMLFNEREMIKSRTQRLENNLLEVARSLHLENISRQQLMDFNQMQGALSGLNVHAGLMWQELQDTIQDLANTRLDLEQTREEMRATQNRLTAAEEQLPRLQEDVAQRTAELARANNQITQLERDKVTLQGRIDDHELQVARIEEEKLELAETIEEQRLQIVELEGIAYPEMEGSGTPQGLSGTIVFVNSEWNFVILNIGSQNKLGVNTEMLVHRDDNLVGRIRVSSVRPQNAIAEILNDWEQSPLQEGDHVLF